MDACECYVIEAGFHCCVYFGRQVPWADFSCTFCLTCGGWLCASQPGPFVLSGGPWILPRAAVVQGQLEAGQSIRQNLGSPCLAVFFSLSAAALVSLSSGSHEQKALGLIFNWNFSWTALKSKLQKWGIHALPVLSSSFQLSKFCCWPLCTSDSPFFLYCVQSVWLFAHDRSVLEAELPTGILAIIKVFGDRGDTHLREFCCCVD